MGSVQQAVLEFDGEVQAPWRPRLVVVPDPRVVVPDPMAGAPAVARRPHPSPRASAVGSCGPSRSPRGAVRRSGGRDERGDASVLRRAAAPTLGDERRRVAVRRLSSPLAQAGLRLTRRARRLAVVLALAAGVALGSWAGPLLAAGGDLRLVGGSSVVVRPGDTLWSIASTLGGDGDVRALVDDIQRLNGLDGAPLAPGQVLRLP